jgi:hypothetical protein
VTKISDYVVLGDFEWALESLQGPEWLQKVTPRNAVQHLRNGTTRYSEEQWVWSYLKEKVAAPV